MAGVKDIRLDKRVDLVTGARLRLAECHGPVEAPVVVPVPPRTR